MSETDLASSSKDVNTVFRALASKYAVEVPSDWMIRMGVDPGLSETYQSPGAAVCVMDRGVIPLCPWRYERRFVELAKLVSTGTVEDVLMNRFSCTGHSGTDLRALLYREFDLLEWLNGSQIKSLYASVVENIFANVLVRLENGCLCSVEVGATLPTDCDSVPIDRHELIGRRGVASDRVVDTQIPQSSIYLYKRGSTDQYTDGDAELFGLSSDEINLVRAAYALAVANSEGALERESEVLLERHARLANWVEQVFQSSESRQHIFAEGILS